MSTIEEINATIEANKRRKEEETKKRFSGREPSGNTIKTINASRLKVDHALIAVFDKATLGFSFYSKNMPGCRNFDIFKETNENSPTFQVEKYVPGEDGQVTLQKVDVPCQEASTFVNNAHQWVACGVNGDKCACNKRMTVGNRNTRYKYETRKSKTGKEYEGSSDNCKECSFLTIYAPYNVNQKYRLQANVRTYENNVKEYYEKITEMGLADKPVLVQLTKYIDASVDTNPKPTPIRITPLCEFLPIPKEDREGLIDALLELKESDPKLEIDNVVIEDMLRNNFYSELGQDAEGNEIVVGCRLSDEEVTSYAYQLCLVDIIRSRTYFNFKGRDKDIFEIMADEEAERKKGN